VCVCVCVVEEVGGGGWGWGGEHHVYASLAKLSDGNLRKWEDVNLDSDIFATEVTGDLHIASKANLLMNSSV
jgi:hypothetical protein